MNETEFNIRNYIALRKAEVSRDEKMRIAAELLNTPLFPPGVLRKILEEAFAKLNEDSFYQTHGNGD